MFVEKNLGVCQVEQGRTGAPRPIKIWLEIYKKLWRTVVLKIFVASHAVCGIVELRVYCFMGKIGSSSANRGELERWGP